MSTGLHIAIKVSALCLALLAATAWARRAPAVPQTPSDSLLDALEKVESSGNAKAVNGTHAGCLQLSEKYPADASWKGRSYRLSDRFSRAKSREMVRSACERYATPSRMDEARATLARLEGRTAASYSDDELLARMHRQGFFFYHVTPKEKQRGDMASRAARVRTTAGYWARVRKEMEG